MVNIILFAIMVICYGLALSGSIKAGNEKEVAMLYWKTEHMTGKKAQEIQENNRTSEEGSLHFTLWGSRKKQTVIFKEYGRTVEAETFYLCGDSRLLFEGDAYIDETDAGGCLISADIAYQLFGNAKIRDLPVTVGDREYIVRGVIADRKNTLAVQADSSTEGILDAAAVEIPGNRTASSVINEYEGRYGAADSKVNLAAVSIWGNLVVGLLPLGMFLTLLVPALKKVMLLRELPMKCLAWLLGMIIFSIMYWKVSGMKLQLPFDFAPSKWSDFSYWGELFKQQSEVVWNFIIMEKRGPEQVYAEKLVETLKYALFSIAAFAFLIRRMEMKVFRDWFLFSVCGIISAFAAVQITETNKNAIAGHSGLWILPLIYLTGMLLLNSLFRQSKAAARGD